MFGILAKSPIFTHVAASLEGLTTIRACHAQANLVKQFDAQYVSTKIYMPVSILKEYQYAIYIFERISKYLFIQISTYRELLITFQDNHSSAWFSYICANRWLAVWLEIISGVFLTIVTLSFLIFNSGK
jgi:hypothetical protein